MPSFASARRRLTCSKNVCTPRQFAKVAGVILEDRIGQSGLVGQVDIVPMGQGSTRPLGASILEGDYVALGWNTS